MAEQGAEARRRVLFLCTRNSARSQMAEGLLRHLAGDRYEAVSAGKEIASVRPEAIAAMDELGVDISAQKSKVLERYLGEPFDYVITVCGAANEACPGLPRRGEPPAPVVQRPFGYRRRRGTPRGVQDGAG